MIEQRAYEQRLIQQILAGRKDSFTLLIQDHLPRLRRHALSRLRNPADAEEVVQESLWKAFSCLRQFRGDANFFTWLHRITENEARLRRRGKRSKLEILGMEPTAVPFAKAAADRSSWPLQKLLDAERDHYLARGLASVPDRYRKVIELRFISGYSLTETAEILSITCAAVKTRQYRALRLLRTKIGDEAGAAFECCR